MITIDPFSTEKSPYEVLGVKPGEPLDPKTLQLKMLEAKRRGVSMKEAREAFDCLRIPSKQAWFRLRQYREDHLSELSPNPVKDSAVLDSTKRAQTAARWEELFRSHFPDLPMAHSLAVFWYWWTIHEEERFLDLLKAVQEDLNGGDGFPSRTGLLELACRRAGYEPGEKTCMNPENPWYEDLVTRVPPLDVMWQRVIGYWTMLDRYPDFWKDRFLLDEKGVQSLSKELRTHMETRLQTKAGEFKKLKGGKAVAEMYGRLLVGLSVEADTARMMDRAQVKKNQRPVRCGAFLLDNIGMLEEMRKWIDKALEFDNLPNKKDLLALKETLSTYAQIEFLISHGKPEDALSAISKLSKLEQGADEVQKLKVKALLELGKQRASLSEIDKAMEVWEEALTTAKTDKEKEGIQTAIVEACNKRAIEIRGKQPEEAIKILDRGYAITENDKLKLQLANLLNQHAVRISKEDFEQIGSDPGSATPAMIKRIKKARDYIKRAKDLGCKDAAGNLEQVERLLADFDFREVFPLMKSEAWQKAIEALKPLIAADPQNTRAKELLMICYSKWAEKVFKEDRNVAEARRLLGLALKVIPDDPIIKQNLAELDKVAGLAVMQPIVQAMNGEEWEKAFKLLENLLKTDPKNAQALEYIGISTLRWADQVFRQTKDLQEVKKILKKGQKYVPDHPVIREQLKQIEDNEHVAESLNRARKAWQKGDLDSAIDCYRKAYEEFEPAIQMIIKKEMANCLTQRGVKTVNDAMAAFQQNRQSPEELMNNFKSVLANMGPFSNKCVMCSNPATHSIPLDDGRNAPICSSCVETMQSALSSPKPGPEIIKKIKTAYLDLSEAKELDPLNENASKNLEAVEKILKDLGEALPSVSQRIRYLREGGRKVVRKAGLGTSGELRPSVQKPRKQVEWKSRQTPRPKPASAPRKLKTSGRPLKKKATFKSRISEILFVVVLFSLIPFVYQILPALLKMKGKGILGIVIYGLIVLWVAGRLFKRRA